MDICYHNSFGLTDRVHQDHLAWKEPREQKVLRYSSEIRYCGSLASTVKGKIQILTVVSQPFMLPNKNVSICC